ncbi:FeoA family protein [Spirulina sp. CCNP1310]|uniref:FeoA family protein n=1 Tax=Spirulina sp. CCNP1310 TaxID=3110249 RepID=UPI002B2018CC|nr:FeoA family protein [Spirulina sp. CCNP1310]MEA5419999.1 FeoA family protein [Spirulina sp. CCNP1310]
MKFKAINNASQASLGVDGSGITFIGGRSPLEADSTHPVDQKTAAATSAGQFPLAMATVGDRLWIVQIQGGHRIMRRLIDLGLTQGSEITVVSRTDSGSMIVGFQGCRIGLGAGIAHRVMVSTTLLDPPTSTPTLPVDAPMTTPLHLGDLAIGQSGRILSYETSHRAYREKLLSMGLTPGTPITITRQAPMGDPIEIEVRGFKLSLRKSEAAALRVEPLAEG